MKFPVLFRVFAVLNILAFFILGIMTVLMITEPADWGLFMIWIQWAVTIWLFVSAIAWFFAGKGSYHFLYTLGTMLLVVCVYWAWFIWASDRLGELNAEKKIISSVVPGVIFLYLVFLVVALFYKPVVEWTEKRFSIKHASIALGIFLIIGAGLFTFAAVTKKSFAVDANLSYPDSKSDEVSYRPSIPGNESIRITFPYVETVNGISINRKLDSAKIETFHFAKVAYSDSADFNPATANTMIIEFNLSDDRLVAEFHEIRAKHIQLYPLSENKQVPSPKVFYFCDGLSAMRFLSVFDKNEEREMPIEETPVAEGETSSEPDVSNGRKISDDTIDDFYNTFFTDTYFKDQSDYNFDYSGNVLEVGEGIRLGLYKRGISYIKPDFNEAVKKFQGFSNYDYERYVYELTGLALYDSKATDYENENNGTAFNYLNPEIITWAEQNLLPKTGHEVLGYTAQDFYDKCFSRMMRMAVLSRLHLLQNEYEGEATLYQQAATGEEFYGPRYLNDRFGELVLDDYCTDETWEGSPEFIGFWLRRKIDNTDQQCWDALYGIMQKYDRDWVDGALGDFETDGVSTDTTTYD
jgi:hypothetical protein